MIVLRSPISRRRALRRLHAHAGQHCTKPERSHGQHRDLAQRIVPAKIDENDVDDVRAAAPGLCIRHVISRDGVVRPRQHGERHDRHAGPRSDRKYPVAQPARSGTLLGWPRRQIPQTHEQKHDRHNFDGELRERQIGCIEAQERQRHDRSRDTQKDHRQQAGCAAGTLSNTHRIRGRRRPPQTPHRQAAP